MEQDSHSIQSFTIRNNDNSTIRRKIRKSNFTKFSHKSNNDKIGNWLGIFSDDYKILRVYEQENYLIYDIYNNTRKFEKSNL